MSELTLPILIAGAILLALFLIRLQAIPRKLPRRGGQQYWWVVPLSFLAGVGVAYWVLR